MRIPSSITTTTSVTLSRRVLVTAKRTARAHPSPLSSSHSYSCSFSSLVSPSIYLLRPSNRIIPSQQHQLCKKGPIHGRLLSSLAVMTPDLDDYDDQVEDGKDGYASSVSDDDFSNSTTPSFSSSTSNCSPSQTVLQSNRRTRSKPNRTVNGMNGTTTTATTTTTSTLADIEELHYQALSRGETSYIDPDTGFTVFTELIHLKRGNCCGNGCRHCPYGYENVRNVHDLPHRPVPKLRSGDTVTAQAMVDTILNGTARTATTTTTPILNTTTTSSIGSTQSTTTTSNGENIDNGLQQKSSAATTATATTTCTTAQSTQPRAAAAPRKNVPYTRGGDKGTSQLGTGERRSKCDCNFEALGTVDELCSVVGVAHAQLLLASSSTGTSDGGSNGNIYGDLPERLLDVMSRLFDVGSHVAKPRLPVVSSTDTDDDRDVPDTAAATTTKDGRTSKRPAVFVPNGIGDGIDSRFVDDLEGWINEMTDQLPELTSFILPTGAVAAAQLHVARTVCRRAERRLVPLVVEEGTCDPNALMYLNRLSDFFFVAARYVNYCEGQEEIQYRRDHVGASQRERVSRTLKE